MRPFAVTVTVAIIDFQKSRCQLDCEANRSSNESIKLRLTYSDNSAHHHLPVSPTQYSALDL